LTVGLGVSTFAQSASSCSCASLSPRLICAHQLHSAVAWDEAATEAGHRQEDGAHEMHPSSDGYTVTADWAFGSSTPPSYTGLPMNNAEDQGHQFTGNLGGPQDAPWLNSQDAHRLAYEPHFHAPPTPRSLGYITTPDSLDDGSPGTASLPIPSSPRKKRRQRSGRYVRFSPSYAGSTLGSSTNAGDVDIAREGLRRWLKKNPHDLEPSIGNPAATAIIGSNLRLGTPGRSLYSALFSSRSGKQPFTCYECGHEEGRFSRAVRHQRQEHFGHYPFPCQGGSGHSACGQWFASDEYATDHVKKAGPTTSVCSQCSKAFANSGNLGRHKKKTHHA